MPADKAKKKEKDAEDAEAEVWNAIAAFEKILDAEPSDRVALETLQEAYERIGDEAQSLAYLCRLAHVVAEEGDKTAAGPLLDKLRQMGKDSPEAKAAATALEQLSPRAPKATPSRRGAGRKPARRVDITNEVSLAWSLLQAGEITQDDYTTIVTDLTESSTKKVQTPVSVLHVLEDRAFKNAGRVLSRMSKDSGMPIVSLSQFELQEKAFKLLDIYMMVRRGAIAFDLMGPDLLVAVLNPYDKDLQQEICDATGKTCHFFLVEAPDYDRALEKVRKAMPEAAPAAQPAEDTGEEKQA